MGDLIIEKTVSGDTVTFQSRIAAPIKSLKVDIMPIQPKTGTPSKDNKQPIYGWTGVKAVVCGENLFTYTGSPFTVDGLTIKAVNGRITIKGDCTATKTSVMVEGSAVSLDASKSYYWYGIPVDNHHLFLTEQGKSYYNINGVSINPNTNYNNRIRFLWTKFPNRYYDLDFTAILTDTPPIRITFPDEIGTVYGGTLDVISGELIVDTIKITVDGSADWAMLSPGVYSLLGSIDNACINTKLSKYRSSMYPFRGTGETKSSGLDKDGYFYIQSSVDRIWVYDSNYSTLADFKAFLNENPLELTYPTTVTTTYQLTATEVKTLLTTNIITSDAGAVTVTYDDKDYTDLIAARRRMLMETPHSENVSGGVASFNTNMAAKLKNLTVNIEPVQSGSGDSSPDNVRPISGWTGCNVTKCGKNIFDQTIMKDQAAWNIIKFYAPVGTRLTMSGSAGNASASGLATYFRQPGGTQGSATQVLNTHSVTQVVPSEGYIEIVQRRISGEGSFQDYRYQIEVGSTATEYEPYNSSTVNIDWTSEAGTVYGGTLDVTTGALTVDRGMVTFTNANTGWFLNNNNGVYYKDFTSTFNAKHNMKLTANYLTSLNSGAGTELTSWQCRYNSANTNLLIKADGIVDASVSAWVEYLTNNPLTLVYELATPQTYQLTPTQVKTLLGNNTIYADTGDVELTYWKH